MAEKGARPTIGWWILLATAVALTGCYVASGFWYVGWSSTVLRSGWEPRSVGIVLGAFEHTTAGNLVRGHNGWSTTRTERASWCAFPIHIGGYWLVPLWPAPACAWLGVTLPLVRRAVRRRGARCVSCGYTRAGLAADAKCPECGTGSVR